MTKSIVINKQKLSVRRYKGQEVLTFKDIDLVHDRPEGTARRNFNTNKSYFIEGVDYFKIQPNEIRTVGITSPNGGIVITESGYLMLVKSFTDELAWNTQRALLTFYFRSKSKLTTSQSQSTLSKSEQLALETSEYHYFDKTYKGEPIITLADFEYISNIAATNVRRSIKNICKEKIDYFFLMGDELTQFKMENPSVKRTIKSIFLLKKSAVEMILKWYKSEAELPKCFTVNNEQGNAIEIYSANTPNVSKEDYLTALSVLRSAIIDIKRLQKRFSDRGLAEMVEFSQKEIEACSFSIEILCGHIYTKSHSDFQL